MIERAAIRVNSLRIVCAGMFVMLIASVDFFAPALTLHVPTKTAEVAAEIRCTHGAVRTRTPGLQRRFLTRDFMAGQSLHALER